MITRFKSPGAELRSVPFWSWNCRVTPELIDSDLDSFVKMGFGGVCLHPRAGLDVVYLSDEYMDLVEYAAVGCEKRGLFLWIYDDDRFPSGAAGGLVTSGGMYRGMYLRVSEIPAEDCVAAWEILVDGETAVSSRRLTGKADVAAALARVGDGRRVKFGYLEYLPEEPWFNGGSYIDVTDPAAVRAFIRLTHERYRQRLGRFFGTTVTAFFTDEPRFTPRLQGRLRLKSPLQHGDFGVPYTPCFARRFMADTGMDALDAVPSLVWPSADPQAPSIRRKYREALCESFNRAYLDQIDEWCARNGVMSTGHILGEESLLSQTDTVGEAMRCYRGMDLPGIDVLIDEHIYAAAAQAASVTALTGKSGVMSELYGSTGWECPFLTYKLQGDWQAALGVTHRVPHLAHMSLEGESKRDWPGSIFTQSPWWERFSIIEDHFARLNAVLRRGRRVTRVAVIHPVEALWELPLCGAEGRRRELSARFDGLIREILFSTIDVCLLSESLLAEGRVSLEDFEAVVAPEPESLRPSSAAALREFKGRAIFGYDGVTQKLKPYRDVSVSRGDAGGHLVCQLRSDGDRGWLFIAHAGDGRDGGLETSSVAVRGEYSVRLWDTVSGAITPVPSRIINGRTEFEWVTSYEGSALFELTPRGSEPSAPPLPHMAPGRGVELPAPISVSMSEPNALLLDRARFSLDGGELSEPEEILRLDNAVRSRLGLAPRGENMFQPWATAPGESHDLTLTWEFTSTCRLPSLSLALERPEEQEVLLNGLPARAADGYFIDRSFRLLALPPVLPGKNVLTVRRTFNAKTNLEPMYLLGDFTVIGGALCPPRPIALGDIVPQGFPHYTGNLTYVFEFTLPSGGPYALRIPKMASPLIDAFLDGSGPTAMISGTAPLGHLSAGAHKLKLIVYGNRYNLLGALHNADTSNPWRGPNSWRTEGAGWSDDHLLHPSALLSSPIIVPLSPSPNDK